MRAQRHIRTPLVVVFCAWLTIASASISFADSPGDPENTTFDTQVSGNDVIFKGTYTSSVNSDASSRQQEPHSPQTGTSFPGDNVPAASNASGSGSSGGGGVGGPLEMVCTGEREGIPGSAARPGDAGAASSHCQYVAGTAPTTPPADEEPAAEDGGGEGEPPSTEELVRTALARVPVSGAGLSWQPRNKSYTNAGVPTIVYAATPSQTHTTALFGREVSITLTASQYSYDFGDSTPPLVTARAGEPWRRGNKEARLTHHYEEVTRGGERRTIVLTTTWDATTTNPFTGQTLTLPSIITTTEQSTPFPVSHLRIDLTDTADEQDGH